MPELAFARVAGLVLAVPLLVILLVGLRLVAKHRKPRRPRVEPLGTFHPRA